MKHTVWYRVPDHCPESAYSLKIEGWDPLCKNPLVQECIAQECAENYCCAHSGWESRWPLTFVVHDTEEGPPLFSALVEREMEPRYSARLIPCS